jgi:carboxymethylenebutenolidase
MCFDTDALPPDPARTGMGVGSERTTLSADDGNRFAATIVRTREPGSAGIAVLPDVRGLHPYYERLAEHVADAGIHAVAIDPYGRTASAQHREDGFDHEPHRAAVRDDGIRADTRAAADALRGLGATAVVSMGFCFGGRASLMQASQPSVDGVIAFYGPPARREGDQPSPLDEAREGLVRAPVLGLYGGADRGIPAEDVGSYEEALEAAGIAHRIVTYPHAPHSFFDRKMTEHADACRDAWARVLGFVDSLPRSS